MAFLMWPLNIYFLPTFTSVLRNFDSTTSVYGNFLQHSSEAKLPYIGTELTQ